MRGGIRRKMGGIFKISGYVSFILFIIKLFIHLYLNSKNGHIVRMSYSSLLDFFSYYNKQVTTEYERLKRRCNTIYFIAVAGFILSLIMILMMNWIK